MAESPNPALPPKSEIRQSVSLKQALAQLLRTLSICDWVGVDAMPTLVRLFALMLCILIPTISHGDELLSDLEELYLTENVVNKRNRSSLGNGSRQSQYDHPTQRTLGIGVSKALVSCAQPSIRAKVRTWNCRI